jgi:hypothetical protein
MLVHATRPETICTHPALQELITRAPRLQVTDAALAACTPQPPQFWASVLVLTSHPSAVLPLQSANLQEERKCNQQSATTGNTCMDHA